MKSLFSVFVSLLLICNAQSQTVGVGTNTPASSAQLDVSSTTKGFLPPRMTNMQRDAILNPVAGLIVWCINCAPSGELQVYNGTSWTTISGNTVSPGLPVVSTTSITNITTTSAVSGGNISIDGGSAVTVRGVCWNNAPNPTIALSTKTTDGTGTGSFVSNITGLTSGGVYYVRAYATSALGTSYGGDSSFFSSVGIGDNAMGGKIAYILQPGDPGYDPNIQHGLIAALADQGISNAWHNGTNILTGASGTALGTGSNNTTLIITSQGNSGNYAAKICRDYSGGGYSDWYLPSRDELAKLYINRVAIGGFSTNAYWSSSEADINNAWTVFFFSGNQSNTGKVSPNNVRAVRAF